MCPPLLLSRVTIASSFCFDLRIPLTSSIIRADEDTYRELGCFTIIREATSSLGLGGGGLVKLYAEEVLQAHLLAKKKKNKIKLVTTRGIWNFLSRKRKKNNSNSRKHFREDYHITDIFFYFSSFVGGANFSSCSPHRAAAFRDAPWIL